MVTQSEIGAAYRGYLAAFRNKRSAEKRRDAAAKVLNEVVEKNRKDTGLGQWDPQSDIQQTASRGGDLAAAIERSKKESDTRAAFVALAEEAQIAADLSMEAAIVAEGLSKELDAQRLEMYEKIIERAVLPQI